MKNSLFTKENFPILYDKPPGISPLDSFELIVGPCAIESETQIHAIAHALHKRGIRYMRGGAFKPRTSPTDFQGLGEEGLKYIRKAADKYRLSVVTEVMSTEDFDLVERYADILQIGTRNMYNYPLLKRAGRSSKTILLKRGFQATLKEYLHSVEYIMSEGNRNIILCERGIRSFDPFTRNVLDIASAISLKMNTGLQVIIDPSHATGQAELVSPLTIAAQSVDLNGSMIEISLSPAKAKCDGHQAMTLDALDQLLLQLNTYKSMTESSNRIIGS
ncbi:MULTISPECIES: 3-deoxy-7-phosphoheptulonate synthase [unclassified Fusibacter]|uniref:3-deoxy-7-phosphoheptulonate synthase n=1 Tax=unclassified Fusibacter TaxID=2624464 RepID=UPI00101265DC|nr:MULTISPECIES: 3-deoxy-7-phosphoheptulonate synthase [unclassified Fusibacter]MCK8061413.1 3-deoxy-7-phosphoheptulonate synthase [Fusibacter sp. A2]NPE23544.1 3-deoxy-7-phosphoheptulonate synthase [Fusibacter sp. A1]RXV58955.1 3-deoxy-7-phosphoheptulonate synthase [Fusibacter sp. A1]